MKTLNKTSVLLVEDDVELRNTISENLKAVDYKVYATRKSVEGLDLFKKYDIDICILDVEMTGMDGFALAAQIRMLNPDMPIIFLASKGLFLNMLKDFEYGVDDYLTCRFVPCCCHRAPSSFLSISVFRPSVSPACRNPLFPAFLSVLFQSSRSAPFAVTPTRWYRWVSASGRRGRGSHPLPRG